MVTEKELQEAFTELLDKIKEVSKQKDEELQQALKKLVPLDTFEERLEMSIKLSEGAKENVKLLRTLFLVLADAI